MGTRGKVFIPLKGIQYASAVISFIPSVESVLQQIQQLLYTPPSIPAECISSDGSFAGISNNPKDVLFYYYPTSGQKIEINDRDSLVASGLQKSSLTFFIIDGFLSDSNSPMSKALSSSYVTKYGTNANVIVVDWGKLSGAQSCLVNVNPTTGLPLYPLVYNNNNVPVVADRLAEFINLLQSMNLLGDDFRLIGQSMGAHICGMAGNYAKQKYSMTYPRITGCDPAGPLFDTLPQPVTALSKGNAKYVIAIHTNMGQMGTTNIYSGHCDIILNGGMRQPGCFVGEYTGEGVPGLGGITGYCSHSYCWRYLDDSIRNDKEVGRCYDSLIFPYPSCFQESKPFRFSGTVAFGENMGTTARGLYSGYPCETYTNAASIIG